MTATATDGDPIADGISNDDGNCGKKMAAIRECYFIRSVCKEDNPMSYRPYFVSVI